jgi:hypothetical protein
MLRYTIEDIYGNIQYAVGFSDAKKVAFMLATKQDERRGYSDNVTITSYFNTHKHIWYASIDEGKLEVSPKYRADRRGTYGPQYNEFWPEGLA